MTEYVSRAGGLLFPHCDEKTHKLSNKSYVIVLTRDGLALKEVPGTEYTGQVYGNVNKFFERSIKTFNDRDRHMGVAAVGEKGSGKSLLMGMIAAHLRKKENMPTIIVNENFIGDGFKNFMATFTQPCMFVFDEFEKTFSVDEQNQILGVLDGLTPAKHFFMFTLNGDGNNISTFLKSRTGRIFYWFNFEGVDSETIDEYCRVHLKNQDHLESVQAANRIYGPISFDVLISLVEDMNRYNEDAREVAKYLNLKIDGSQLFVGKLCCNGEFVSNGLYRNYESTTRHPLFVKHSINFDIRFNDGEKVHVDKDGEPLVIDAYINSSYENAIDINQHYIEYPLTVVGDRKYTVRYTRDPVVKSVVF